jgi:hypothetical protein
MAEALSLQVWESQGIIPLQRKLADFVHQMQQTIEINREGIPMSYIDPTIIAECVPHAETTDDIPEQKFRSAIVPISFEDGIPAVEGIPFWERLDGEKMDYYKIFKLYRDMRYLPVIMQDGVDTSTSASSATSTASSLSTPSTYVVGNRSMASLAERLNINGKLVNILARIYHWSIRVKCYDLYKERELALRKRIVAEELEHKHSQYSNKLLEDALKWLDTHPASINAKTAMQMIEIGMKYGRISVGLLGDKPGAQSSAVHQTNISVSSSHTINEADQMIIANGGANQSQGRTQGSAVERQMAANMQDPDNMMSILHVLNSSGALETAVKTSLSSKVKQMKEQNDDIIEVNAESGEEGE